MKTLTIRLTAPLQSYGNEANFARRTSADYPSKSAVVGMIAAALGYERDDKRVTALNALQFAVRIDQPGRPMTDFQTVEYKQGKRKLTYRDYLQDAVFVVAIASKDDAQIERIESAIKHPRFPLFLGRRANVPAGVMRTQLFAGENPVEVLDKHTWEAAPWYQKRSRQATREVELIADAQLLPDKPQVMVKDQAGSFDPRSRRYEFRAVARKRLSVKNQYYQDTATTDHDIWGSL